MSLRRLAGLLWLCAAALFAQPSRFVFAVVADPQIGMKAEAADREQFVRVAAALNALRGPSRPDFVLFAGDLFNDAKIETQVTAVDAIRKSLAFPQYSVPGNHDPNPAATPATFSFVHQDCLFLGLDSNLWSGKDAGAAEKQFSWLEAQLRQRDKYRLVFIVQHYPIYLHDPEEQDDYYNTPLAWRSRLLKLYESARVTACIAGHLHKNTTGSHRGISLLVTPSALTNNDSMPPGFRLIEVNSAGFAETYVPVVAKQ
jgi:serine/threonine-protein phosphatase CPPED1